MLRAVQVCVEERASNVAVLNFASAKNPGGGFLGGSLAQEESLATASALYTSLISQETSFYCVNRRPEHKAFYTHRMISSPHVPVFRDDTGELLAQPYTVGMLSLLHTACCGVKTPCTHSSK